MTNSEKEKPLLEVNNLKKYFDITKGWFQKQKQYLKAVDGVSFKVYEGETLGIVGESGCGKSTTGNVILRLLEATEGEVLFEGRNYLQLSPKELRQKRRDMQVVFQDPFSSLNPRMRVSQLIAEPLIAHEIASGKELRKMVTELMTTVGLSSSFIDRYPHEFSGGQRQRIGIARALALKPKLIICDEPVSALDVSIQSQILNLLSKLQKEFQLTYIFIAHGLPVVKHISDRIAVMYLGKIVELASKEQIFSSPKHPYTEGLFAAVPIPDPSLREQKKRIILEGDMPSPANPPSGCRFHTRCSYSQEKCKMEEPLLVDRGDGHMAACHFPLTSSQGTFVASLNNGMILKR
ncbi:peptide/nickel transport system ATP-binding protein [Desulfitobacterium sp. LBE]|uniref:ABC transporter ATP-binding protein n=1 Tax=Desulfitobacterium sp. LBE TaxID=884086 RepID=UPI00119A5A4B|nr:dipeptide ABC transporter ATP-binding protein [Desulfitobacterium sp. LBE]TWH58123.1 peptide/nickel transport system ATP-binding protein [Desulfitobacterium sp. LBE]